MLPVSIGFQNPTNVHGVHSLPLSKTLHARPIDQRQAWFMKITVELGWCNPPFLSLSRVARDHVPDRDASWGTDQVERRGMGLFGILLQLGLLMWFAYRGWGVLQLAPAAVLVVTLVSSEPLLPHWTATFMNGNGAFCRTVVPNVPAPLPDGAAWRQADHALGGSCLRRRHLWRRQRLCRILRAGAHGPRNVPCGEHPRAAHASRNRSGRVAGQRVFRPEVTFSSEITRPECPRVQLARQRLHAPQLVWRSRRLNPPQYLWQTDRTVLG